MVGEVKSEFVEGILDSLVVVNELIDEGYTELAQDLQGALVKLVNAYHSRLLRMVNRIETEESVLEHAQKHMKRVVFPGDLRAEGEEPENV